MSAGNQYLVKRELYPEWYTHGPVVAFTKEQIDTWQSSQEAEKMYRKIDAQKGMTKEDIMYLDDMKLAKEEAILKEQMQGPTEGSDE